MSNGYTIEQINGEERDMVSNAVKKYGEYYQNADQFNGLLQNGIASVSPDIWIFVMFLSQVKKHITLSLFSTARLHHIQAMLNLRYALEAGVNAAYALANPSEAGFVVKDSNGILTAPNNLKSKRYKWMQENYPEASKAINGFKSIINDNSAHSNIIYAFKTFAANFQEHRMETPYFDIEDEYHVKTDLWQIGNIVMGLVDLFYGVNLRAKQIVFADDFIQRLKSLEAVNHKLKAEMQNTDRYKKSQELKQ